jgi:hypothetical protein
VGSGYRKKTGIALPLDVYSSPENCHCLITKHPEENCIQIKEFKGARGTNLDE